MTISNIIIEDGCISCEICQQTCPEVFEMQSIAAVKSGVDLGQFEEKIREAAEGCPVDVITLE